MTKSGDLRALLALKREGLRRAAPRSLIDFIYFVKNDYRANWHHKLIADEIQNFLLGDDCNRLMLFVPPQHGKSRIASVDGPAWWLGVSPDCKIAAASYSIDLARSFNRQIQRTIDSPEYNQIFPETNLSGKRAASTEKGAWLRNADEFEIVGKSGSYKAVGILGGLSGRPVDLLIIDDPVKDKMEASSQVYRDRVWEWYTTVSQTRLHNKSKQILIMTRWHEDDLAGRLLDIEGDSWHVVKLPAILESETDRHEKDPRKLGEALWPDRHSADKLTATRLLSETNFQSLYQQNPTTPGGNKVKEAWFQYCNEKEVPPGIIKNLWIDGAYTKLTENDPTGLMVAGYSDELKRLYIFHALSDWLEMPDLLKLIPEYADLHGLFRKSRVLIEPKASGKSLRQMINALESSLSAVEIKTKLVNEGKNARLSVASPKIESGKVWLVKGSWNQGFVSQITGFPNATHDEYVDLIGYACDRHFAKGVKDGKSSGVRRRN